MPSFSRLNRGQLNTLAKELGIDPDDFERADDLRTFINANTNDDDLNTAMLLFEEDEEDDDAGEKAADTTDPQGEEAQNASAGGSDLGSAVSTGNDETFEEVEPSAERIEVTNPEGETVIVTVLGETDEGTVVREDGTMRRFVI